MPLPRQCHPHPITSLHLSQAPTFYCKCTCQSNQFICRVIHVCIYLLPLYTFLQTRSRSHSLSLADTNSTMLRCHARGAAHCHRPDGHIPRTMTETQGWAHVAAPLRQTQTYDSTGRVGSHPRLPVRKTRDERGCLFYCFRVKVLNGASSVQTAIARSKKSDTMFGLSSGKRHPPEQHKRNRWFIRYVARRGGAQQKGVNQCPSKSMI